MKKSIVFTSWISGFIMSLTQLCFAQDAYYGVDVRDLKKFKTVHQEFSSILMSDFKQNICVYVECPTKVRWTAQGAQGPEGKMNNDHFVIDRAMSETRTNTIFSAEIENVTKLSEQESVYKIILFLHDENKYADSRHFFFRRLSVSVKNKNVSKVEFIQDIPLKQTYFSFYVDILERKTILKDSQNGITKVFPIAVGALDIRNFSDAELFAASLTHEFVNKAQIRVGQPAGLHLSRADKGGMYHNRPFLGIADDNGSTYKQIGWHYQMDSGDLQRAFLTHGCFRTEDKNLYQMSAIVFANLQEFVPVKVVTRFAQDTELQSLAQWTHPMPLQNDYYYSVGYLDKSVFSEEYVSKIRHGINQLSQGSYLSDVEQYYWCKGHGQTVYNHSESDQPGLRQYGSWSTVLDGYCLTKIVRNNTSVEPVLDFILGKASNLPEAKTLEPHYPIVIAGLCDGSLDEAQKIFAQHESRQLTFRSYISNCGCDQLKRMLDVSLIRSAQGIILNTEQKTQMYKKYCD